MRWFYRWYGASPLHLLTLIASFALAGYAAEKLLPRNTEAILVWFAGAVIGHDLLLMPLYTIADRSVMAVFGHRRSPHPPTVSWVNYLRIPAVLSGLLLLIWFPLIFRLPANFTILTGLSLNPYLGHWLAVTGVLFLLSALTLAVRLGTLLGKRRPTEPEPDPEEFRRPAGVTTEQPYGGQPYGGQPYGGQPYGRGQRGDEPRTGGWGRPADEPRTGGLLRGPAPGSHDRPWGPPAQPPPVPPWEQAPPPGRAPRPADYRPQAPRRGPRPGPQPPPGQSWGRAAEPRHSRPPTWPR
jgi:hypothetical protein